MKSHAASAFFPSPFDESAILTLDGVGEWATASYGVGRGNRVDLTHELRFPHSLGLLYSAFTYFTGFKVNSGEYKLMGLAPYGEPRYVDTILNHLIDLKPDGLFRMDMSYFRYCQGLRMTSSAFDRLFDGPPRQAEATITQREMDIAASIQAVTTEEVMLRCATHVHRETGMRNLVLAGGVALNCVGNGRIVREGPFEKVWIQPASGDAGGALGVALFIWHQLLDHPRIPDPIDSQHGSLLGPVFSDDVVGDALDSLDAVYHRFDDDDSLCEAVADLLASGKVVGWFQGRMEFGPRALGSRSILGDPRSEEMQSVMNLKDQVPRVVPTLRRRRCFENASMSGSRWTLDRRAPTCCSWHRCATRNACPRMGPVAGPASTDSSSLDRRYPPSHTSTTPLEFRRSTKPVTAGITGCSRPSPGRRGARPSSTPASTCEASRASARLSRDPAFTQRTGLHDVTPCHRRRPL